MSFSAELKNCALPPHHTQDTLGAAFTELRALLGPENVEIVSTASLDDKSYYDPPKTHDPFHILGQDELVASAVLRPGSTEDVQAIVKLANKHRLPIWPTSIGRNFGYGGAAPRVRGSAVVDLGARMNKVLDLNEPNAFALIEPGVTFLGLYEEIQRRGMKLWVDSPDLGGGSVLGNTLDRGVGYTPYGDHFGTHCGMEVVLPNGEVVRTGMGALPDKNQPTGSANTWQLFPYGFGPFHDGIFTQSNYGIVTKMGVWLMPDPGGYQAFMISFQKDEDLHPAIEIIRPLRIAGILQNTPSIRSATLDLAVGGPRKDYSLTGKPLTSAEIDNAVAKSTTKIGRWSFYGALYGPEAVRDVFWAAIKGAFSKIPGATFHFPSDVPPEKSVLHIREGTLRGLPTFTELEWTNFVPNGSAFFFSPISPVSGDHADRQYKLAKDRCDEFGFDYIGTFTVGMRELHHIVCLVFDRTNEEEKKRAYKMLNLMVQDCADAGYGEYRTHLALMDQIAGTYNWNDNALMKLNETLKDALDPNGIMAPGKSGVWPQAYREVKKRVVSGTSKI